MLQTVAYGMLWKGHDSKHQKIQNAFFVGTVAQEKKKKKPSDLDVAETLIQGRQQVMEIRNRLWLTTAS